MTTVNAIDIISDFLKNNVCNELKYLLPDKKDAREYIPKMVSPQVFQFYEPDKERVPPGIEYTCPSVVVQLQKRSDNVKTGVSQFDIQLSFTTWRLGQYITQNNVSLEDITQNEEGVDIAFVGNNESSFVRNEEGWRDVYHFLETTKDAIVKVGKIKDLKLKLDENINSGPFTQDGALIDHYPYYHAWLTLSFETVVTPVLRDIEEFL